MDSKMEYCHYIMLGAIFVGYEFDHRVSVIVRFTDYESMVRFQTNYI